MQRAEACQQRTRELNPMVELVVDIDDIMKKSEEFFKKFDVVCLIGHVKETQVSSLIFVVEVNLSIYIVLLPY